MEKLGLNDLTLEKLITEINGYKEKMRAIHEDYGRASQELQDRINVLGYTLNDHLKETKDQMATTPQRLLNLETKYVTGEVSDNEYRSQRQEFKGLLEKNLQSIEEIRQMIDTLSHIETKPLSPGEFKQSIPNTVNAALGPDWTKAAPSPNRPSPLVLASPPIQPPSLKVPITSPMSTALNAEIAETSPQTSSPAPLPQNNGNTAPAPQTSNAVVTPGLVEDTPPQSALTTADSALATGEAESGIVSDESIGAGPSPDLVEDVADALVVKVVDDMPVVDASAAVASTETSQLQPPVSGTETIPGVQPSSDLSTVGLAPPSQFYKVVCPKCGADVPKPVKVWELKGGKSKKNVLIGLFQCQDCRVKFREALTREII